MTVKIMIKCPYCGKTSAWQFPNTGYTVTNIRDKVQLTCIYEECSKPFIVEFIMAVKEKKIGGDKENHVKDTDKMP